MDRLVLLEGKVLQLRLLTAFAGSNWRAPGSGRGARFIFAAGVAAKPRHVKGAERNWSLYPARQRAIACAGIVGSSERSRRDVSRSHREPTARRRPAPICTASDSPPSPARCRSAALLPPPVHAAPHRAPRPRLLHRGRLVLKNGAQRLPQRSAQPMASARSRPRLRRMSSCNCQMANATQPRLNRTPAATTTSPGIGPIAVRCQS